MPMEKKRMLRLLKLVGQLKARRYPNAVSFTKLLREAEMMENLNIACKERTFMRDLAVLREEFHAPIEFDHERNGYYLRFPAWEFKIPVLADDALLTTLLGARVAGEVLPSPLREKVMSTMESSLATSDTTFYDRTFFETLLIASEAKTTVRPEIFEALYQTWRQRCVVHLTYRTGSTGKISAYDFEPHLIASHRGNWYVKGREPGRPESKVLAVFRIVSAEKGHGVFAHDRKLLEDTRRNGLFDYPKIAGITVRCSREIAYYLHEQQKARKLAITPQEDGSLIVALPPSPEHEALRWILGEGGNVEVLTPESLRETVRLAGERIARVNHQDSPPDAGPAEPTGAQPTA